MSRQSAVGQRFRHIHLEWSWIQRTLLIIAEFRTNLKAQECQTVVISKMNWVNKWYIYLYIYPCTWLKHNETKPTRSTWDLEWKLTSPHFMIRHLVLWPQHQWLAINAAAQYPTSPRHAPAGHQFSHHRFTWRTNQAGRTSCTPPPPQTQYSIYLFISSSSTSLLLTVWRSTQRVSNDGGACAQRRGSALPDKAPPRALWRTDARGCSKENANFSPWLPWYPRLTAWRPVMWPRTARRLLPVPLVLHRRLGVNSKWIDQRSGWFSQMKRSCEKKKNETEWRSVA